MLPPSLPICTLEAAFQCSDSDIDIPPAFYPGQAIPTILTFRLDRYSSLAHSLNPTLTMSLVGTLHLPNSGPRTIICVSVSLSEGLELWARDAQQAYASRVLSPEIPMLDPDRSLPGGTYSLPLTVQVPSTPRLPPSFNVSGASFAVTYALSVQLTCDDPMRLGARVHLAETAREFEMMPETLPSRTPRYNSNTFWVKGERPSTAPSSGIKSFSRRANTKWTVEPFLPTTAFSPTSTIPIRLKLSPPTDDEGAGISAIPFLPLETHYQILVRLAVVRREHLSSSRPHLNDPASQSDLVREEEVMSQYAWFESRDMKPMEIKTSIPLMLGNHWTHGFSLMLNVGTSVPEMDDIIAVSSTFHLCTTLAFLPRPARADRLGLSTRCLADVVPDLPPRGTFTHPTANPPFDLTALKRDFPGTIRTLPLPIVVGSVSEPRSAMRTVRWSDLQLERTPEGEEVGRIISGETYSCGDGWIQAPPSYVDAIATVPYEY